MKKVLKNNKKTKQYLDDLPVMYLVSGFTFYHATEYPFSGKYVIDPYSGKSIPLVWVYDDHNGTTDNFYLKPITYTTMGNIIVWTESAYIAKKIAGLFNDELEGFYRERLIKSIKSAGETSIKASEAVKELGDAISDFGERLEVSCGNDEKEDT